MNIDSNTARHLEGYAAALQDILFELTGDNCNSKSYDPMTIGDKIHSYAFNLKSGGRHHDLKDFESVEELKKIMLDEIIYNINLDSYD